MTDAERQLDPTLARMESEAAFGSLGLDGWAGRYWTRVEIVGETPKRYRIRAIERTKLAGRNRWLDPGQEALVPKAAVRRV